MEAIQDELMYIENNLGRMSLKAISENLGKPIHTIQTALIRKKGTSNTKIHTGMLTAGELAKALGVDRNTVMGWIERHELKHTKRITNKKKRFTFIDVEDFWAWAGEDCHKCKIDWSAVQPHSLPPEPSWVAEERKNKKKISKYKNWTIQEENRMLELYRAGVSISEIAVFLERTPGGVEKKISRINTARTKNNNEYN